MMTLMTKAVAGWRYFRDVLVKRDEKSRYVLAEALARQVYPRYKFSEFGRLIEYDEDFIRFYEKFCGTDNYHSLDRKYTLDQLMKLVTDIEGDTVECGVWMGASSYLMCRRIVGLRKTHHIFDSFEGLSKPGSADGSHWTEGGMACDESVVRRNLREFDFVTYRKGWIPERLHEVSNERFCFIHLDVDLFQPTFDAVAFFYERTSPGGIIVCDDYGFITCPGAKAAMDEFFSDKPEKIVCLSTGQAVVFKK
jgi:hypothetical protein